MTSPFATLAPLAVQLRQREANVRPISQVVLQLPSGEPSFSRARSTVTRWMNNRAGRKLPTEAWNGDTFELEDVGAQRTAAVSIVAPRYWAARLDDADRTVAQRVWTTEIGIAERQDKSILFGCRLLCVTRGADIAFVRSVPGFVRNVSEDQEAHLDGRPVSIEPWVIEDESSVDDLVAMLRDRHRQSDVIVFSLPEDSENPLETIVSARQIAKSTIGVAHVVIITGPASFYLSDRVGKEFSVFRQAVRTYKVGFDPAEDEPFNHPLALPQRITTWPDGGGSAFEAFLIDRVLAASVNTRDYEHKLPSFTTVRRAAAEIRIASAREAGSSETDLLKIADEEILNLRKFLDEERQTSAGLWKVAEEERDQALAEAQQVKETNSHLRYRIERLEQQLIAKGGAAAETPIPDNLSSFENWCRTYLAGYVEIHNRAYQGIKKSEYDDISLIYRSLLVLRDYYVTMKRHGGLDKKRSYEEACQALGLEEAPTFSGPRAGEEGEIYFIRYAGRRVELDRHLKKGNSREPRHCFRLYFFWDDDDQQVVVGWLPSHLDTRQT